VIRPMRADDVEACFAVQWAALSQLDARNQRPTPELTEVHRVRGVGRVAHLLATDPQGAWVAEQDGIVVGCALALVREGMWFLSLLMVEPSQQGKGLGKALLDATLTTSTDRSWILATDDPAALRRYQRAGFDLHVTYTAKGHPGPLEPAAGVIAGDYDLHSALVDDVTRQLRGAGFERDLPAFRVRPAPFLVVDDCDGQGFVFLRPGGVIMLGANTEHAARRLLVARLAAAEGEIEVDWLSAGQQWAIDVCLDARLTLGYGGTMCLRGQPRMALYLPGGALG
jgi:GNAT superfamily N-acetyltransferase